MYNNETYGYKECKISKMGTYIGARYTKKETKLPERNTYELNDMKNKNKSRKKRAIYV